MKLFASRRLVPSAVQLHSIAKTVGDAWWLTGFQGEDDEVQEKHSSPASAKSRDAWNPGASGTVSSGHRSISSVVLWGSSGGLLVGRLFEPTSTRLRSALRFASWSLAWSLRSGFPCIYLSSYFVDD